MRKIKFRGISKKTGEFVFGDLVINKSTETYRIFSDFALCVDNVEYKGTELIGCSGSAEIVLKETIGQLTGLKDKNGKQIYEGDIVKHAYDGISEVVFGKLGYDGSYNGLSGFALKDWYQEEGFYELNYYFDNKDMEIIGNVHKNKELLEAK